MPSDEDVLKQAGMIAGEQLVILKKSGEMVRIVIGVGEPYAEGDNFRCKVYLGEIQSTPLLIGATSLSVLCSAIGFLKFNLKLWEDQFGWKLFHTEEGTPLSACDEELKYNLDLFMNVEFGSGKNKYATSEPPTLQ